MNLDDILITSQLATRKSRPVNVFAERRAFNTIARRTAYGRDAILFTICELVLDVCAADSVGISVLCEDEEQGFTWDAVAGRLEGYAGGKAPRYHSPCGVCLDRGETQLFAHPERYFTWIQKVGLSIAEGLVIPLYKERRAPYGAIWILAQDERRHFDSEDARIMTALGRHAAAALQTQQAQR
jgi:hypothetical protein